MDLSPILTSRLRLALLDRELLEDCLTGHAERAAARLRIAAIAGEFLADHAYLAMRWQDLRADTAYAPFGPRALLFGDPPEMIGDLSCHAVPGDPALRERLAQLLPAEAAHPAAGCCCEIGYRVYPRWRGRGVASEAVAGLLAWLQAKHDVRWVVASIAPANAPSRRLVQRLGFERIGEWIDPRDGPEEVWLLRQGESCAGH